MKKVIPNNARVCTCWKDGIDQDCWHHIVIVQDVKDFDAAVSFASEYKVRKMIFECLCSSKMIQTVGDNVTRNTLMLYFTKPDGKIRNVKLQNRLMEMYIGQEKQRYGSLFRKFTPESAAKRL